ncbi:50S ribosomal protein L13 [Candidatus Woesearchaeota archaeon]|nr:50S ribosomal protein L13 [Candidatus Woesearchaeota archaeon]
MIVIDATNLILGRFATFAAKQALLGEDVRVINAEKAIISGSKAKSIEDAKVRRNRGTPAKGPFIPRVADRYVRRTIRGMLPHRQAKGAEAYKRVLCYVGKPEEFKDVTPVSLPHAEANKLPNLKFTTVEEVIKNL